ncbi:hypothetical protein DL767_009764 [Monosporascus sp. MG133]|nr:hypothetical protein DL767_009764 [Monosporascus sp. MG133]
MSCAACFTGTVHQTETKGKVSKLHNRDTYVSGPELIASKGVVVVISDAFGWELPNTRIWADRLAEKGGWTVLVPDFMDGRAAPVSLMDTMHNLTKKGTLRDTLWKPYHALRAIPGFAAFGFFNRFGAAWPRVRSYFAALRSAPESSRLPVGVVGFCWGGLYAVKLAADGKGERGLVDAAFTAHPQPLTLPEDVAGVVKPTAVAIGDRDWAISLSGIEVIRKAFTERSGEGVECELVLYEGAGHGFAVRYDPGNDKLAEQAEAAENQAVAWFSRWFAAAQP